MFIIYIHKIYRNSKLFARFAHMMLFLIFINTIYIYIDIKYNVVCKIEDTPLSCNSQGTIPTNICTHPRQFRS